MDIRARVKAFLQTQNYTEGTMVQAGQVLFTLDKREYEAQLMQAKAQLAKAEADLAQAQEKSVVDTAQANLRIATAQLNKSDRTSSASSRSLNRRRCRNRITTMRWPPSRPQRPMSRAEGRAEYRQGEPGSGDPDRPRRRSQAANANIRQAELNVEYCTITSPITGIAGTRQVAPGNLVGQGEATLLTTVSNVNPMRVYMSISEREYLMYQRLRAEGKMKGGAAELELILADGSDVSAKKAA